MFTCPKCAKMYDAEYQLDNHTAQAHTRLFTIDDYLITDGMPVWDYDLKLVLVDLSTAKPEYGGDVWFQSKTPTGERTSMMNGARVWVRHPSTGQRAVEALAALVPVTLKVTLTWPDGSEFIWTKISEETVENLTELLGDDYDLKV